MEIRFAIGQQETKGLDTEGLRSHFLVSKLFQVDKLNLVYSHHDRMIIGGVIPQKKSIVLSNPAELRAEYFLERREMGVINLGGRGEVIADGKAYPLRKLECIYLGKGVKKVSFASLDEKKPAQFYILSSPAHASYPTVKYTKEKASPVSLGDASTSNKRTVFKYIHKDGIQSCQLVMGVTALEKGSVWNSVPPHTHTRRMEVYLYFDLDAAHRVFHFMGQPQETRHLVMENLEAVISPPWSMHFGCGTSNYTFVWGMAGENLDYTDMDPAPIATIK
ncbi:MAG: 5-dehydro-4-deoxy-D-glucuronate isomerase [Bacteroidota bacterium]